ncbi:MAG: phosphate-starvation-inducible PsiE family protein [candidate division WOR-3 bacterium]
MKVFDFILKMEKNLHVLVAIALLMISFGILVYTCFNTLRSLIVGGEDTIHVFILAIQDILLVIIVLELLWTVVTYIRMESIPLEPFLYVAIISAVRALILHATKTIEAVSSGEPLLEAIAKPAFHVFEILIIAVALYIVRSSKRFIS